MIHYPLTFKVDPYPVAGETISKKDYTLSMIVSTGNAVNDAPFTSGEKKPIPMGPGT